MKIILAIILACFWAIVVNANDERIFIGAKINGKPVRLNLDTGSDTPLVLYAKTAKRLGLKIISSPDPHPPAGQVAYSVTEPCNVEFEVDKFRTSLRVVEIPDSLKPIEDGFMGWKMFSDNIISLDAVAHKITCLSNIPAEAIHWSKFRLQTNSDILGFELSSQKGSRAIAFIDTGSSSGIELNPQKWTEWKTTHANQATTLESYYTSALGFVVREEMWADKISLGEVTITAVPVESSDTNDLAAASLSKSQYEATLGYAALKRLDMIIDGPHGVIYMQAKNTTPLPYQHNRLGASFDTQHSSGLPIAKVIDSSPAYEAGIRNGDVLMKINGRMNGQQMTSFDAFFHYPPGTKLEFTLKRGDKIFTTTAVLRNIIPPDSARN